MRKRYVFYKIVDIVTDVEAAAAAAGVSNMWSGRAGKDKVRWRWQYFRLAMESGYSATSIARSMGADHTTIIYGLTRWQELMSRNDSHMASIDRLARARLAEREPYAIETTEPPARFCADCIVDKSVTAVSALKPNPRWHALKQARIDHRQIMAEQKRQQAADECMRLQLEMEAERQKNEMLRLRRLGWSVPGLARRYEMDVMEVENVIGVRVYERDAIF